MLGVLAGQLGPLGSTNRRAVAAPAYSIAGAFGSDLVGYFDGPDAATVIRDSGFVTAWTDKSPAGITPTASGSERPTYATSGINGLGSIRFGSGQGLRFPSNPFAGATEATAFVVSVNVSESADYGSPLEHFGSVPSSHSHVPYAGEIYDEFATDTRKSPITFTPGTLIVPQLHTRRSGPGLWSMTQGRTTIFTTAVNTFATGESPSIAIGSGLDWLGDIALIVLVKRLVTNTEFDDLANDCTSKWGTP